MTLEFGPCSSASINTCKDCGVVFPSSRSLGMHWYHRHPVEVNHERIVELQGRRKGWTSGEDAILRTKADSSWRQGMRRKDHLTHLHVTFPHRTIEALKKRLQILKWKPPETSMELQQQSPIREDVTDQRCRMTTRTRGSTWTMEVEHLPTQTNSQQVELPVTRTANKRGKISKNWLEEEDKLLINKAMNIWVEGMTKRELADKLCPYFHCRTSEAIRKRLQKINWTPRHETSQGEPSLGAASQRPEGSPILPHESPILVMSAQTSMLDQSIPLQNDIATSISAQPVEVESWRKDMLEKAYQTMEDSRIQPEKLRNLIRNVLEGRETRAEGARLFKEHAAKVFPTRWRPAVPKRTLGKKPRSNKQIRRAMYASIQKLYKLRKKDAAKTILEGRWKEAYKGQQQVEGMEDYWENIYAGVAPAEDPPPITERAEPKWEIISPITAEELTGVLRGMGNTAMGMDRKSAKELLTWDQSSPAGFCNMILALETMPPSLANARVTFIPKVEVPETPGDYRPIAVSSVLTRALHKILARRMRDYFKFSPLQYAFLKRDGCLEASTLLQALFRRTHDEGKPIAMLFLDIAKAFDTVAHDTILEAARGAGAPDPLINYLANLYEETEVNIGTRTTKCGRGVRQGDPLSPLLFILVMDKAVKAACPGIGAEIGGQHIDAIAYTDDLVLVAQNSEDLQLKLEGFCRALKGMGMSLNEKKSKAITILKDRRRKCLLLTPHSYFTNEGEISAMGVLDKQKYLGLHFTWKGKVTPKHTGHLEKMLHELTSALLKPYQRLDLLKIFLVPRLVYELVLGGAHRNTLTRMDRMIRAAVRKWMRLPKDTPLAYLHSSYRAGGLDIPSLSTSIPIWQRSRSMKLLSSTSSIDRAVTELPSFQKALIRINRPCRIGEVITSMKEAREEWAQQLAQSVDGKDLTINDVDEASHLWLEKPARVFPRLHLRGIQLRGGVLPTKARGARGRETCPQELRCRGACQVKETLNHILQRCDITHDARCARHNRVMRRLEVMLKKGASTTWVEPIIPTSTSFIKPDLLIGKNNTSMVMDVSIVAGSRMEETWRLKTRKYSTPENTRAISTWLQSPTPLQHTPVIISYKGLMYGPSGRALRDLGLTKRDISDLCLLTVAGSLKTYDLYMRGT